MSRRHSNPIQRTSLQKRQDGIRARSSCDRHVQNGMLTLIGLDKLCLKTPVPLSDTIVGRYGNSKDAVQCQRPLLFECDGGTVRTSLQAERQLSQDRRKDQGARPTH